MQVRQSVLDRIIYRQTTWENGGNVYRVVAGNFDGQGMSLGGIQFAAGQGTLQPVLIAMHDAYPLLVQSIFRAGYDEYITALYNGSFFAWAVSINVDNHTDGHVHIPEPWRSRFEIMANSAEFQKIEKPFIMRYVDMAVRMATGFQALNPHGERVDTDRGLDCFFDAACQCGGREPYVWAYENTFAEKMTAFVEMLAGQSNPEWTDDVRARKMAIIRPEGGWVHGSYYRGEYDDMVFYDASLDETNAVPPAPRPEAAPQPQPTIDYEIESMVYLQDKGVYPAFDPTEMKDRLMTWGEQAATIRKNNIYLWENYLKFVRRD